MCSGGIVPIQLTGFGLFLQNVTVLAYSYKLNHSLWVEAVDTNIKQAVNVGFNDVY